MQRLGFRVTLKQTVRLCFAGLLLGFLPEPWSYLCIPFGWYLGALLLGYMTSGLEWSGTNKRKYQKQAD